MKTKAFVTSALFVATSALAELPAGHPSLPDIDGKTKEDATTNVPLPNEGRILEAFQSGGYTYIKVTNGEQSQWLAAPRMKLEKGMLIRYSKGILMANFHSRSLDRTFEHILLVGNIKIVEP